MYGLKIDYMAIFSLYLDVENDQISAGKSYDKSNMIGFHKVPPLSLNHSAKKPLSIS